MPRVAYATKVEAAQRKRDLMAARRMLACMNSKGNLLHFTQFTMPDPSDPEDSTKSRFQVCAHHKLIAEELMKVETGETRKLIITVPPRHGKSELSSRRFVPWFIGRDPYRCVMLATYNQPFAEDFGRDVRSVMQSDAYKQVFPKCTLRKGSAASDRLQTEEGGLIAFVGRGGSITGRGADLFIVDDPLKNRGEADSQVEREKMWKWWNDDVLSRMMTDDAKWVIIQTRWHEDDLVGRLTDPENINYIPEEADGIKVVHLAAVAKMYGAPEEDPLNRSPGQVLWPERFSPAYFDSFRRRNPLGFASLYQGVPTPLDGDLFKRDDIQSFIKAPDIATLRIYAASDHAVTTKQANDATVLLIAGIDPNDNIYVLDTWWGREKPDYVVERMIDFMRRWKPLLWWAESDHISKSIGPFLRKRMLEEKTYINMVEISNSGADKVKKAQPIIGRSGMKMIHLPKTAPWFEQAIAEMMKFPHGKHNDWVDALANIGRGLDFMHGTGVRAPKKAPPKSGTLAWIKQESKAREAAETSFAAAGGW